MQKILNNCVTKGNLISDFSKEISHVLEMLAVAGNTFFSSSEQGLLNFNS
jgi:hypothetical protein